MRTPQFLDVFKPRSHGFPGHLVLPAMSPSSEHNNTSVPGPLCSKRHGPTVTPLSLKGCINRRLRCGLWSPQPIDLQEASFPQAEAWDDRKDNHGTFQWLEPSNHTSNRKPHCAMPRWPERARIDNPAGLFLGQPAANIHTSFSVD